MYESSRRAQIIAALANSETTHIFGRRLFRTMGKGHGRAAANNRANQMNPNNPAYYSSHASTKAAADNHSNQLNDNNPAYWSSRGLEKPESEASEEE
jgi:hypothetical protein